MKKLNNTKHSPSRPALLNQKIKKKWTRDFKKKTQDHDQPSTPLATRLPPSLLASILSSLIFPAKTDHSLTTIPSTTVSSTPTQPPLIFHWKRTKPRCLSPLQPPYIHGRSSQITLPFFILTIKPSSNQHWNGSLKSHKTALWITAEESAKPAAPAVAPSSFSSSTIPVAVKDISITAQTSSFRHRRLIKPWTVEAPPSNSTRDCSLSATPFLNYSRAFFFFLLAASSFSSISNRALLSINMDLSIWTMSSLFFFFIVATVQHWFPSNFSWSSHYDLFSSSNCISWKQQLHSHHHKSRAHRPTIHHCLSLTKPRQTNSFLCIFTVSETAPSTNSPLPVSHFVSSSNLTSFY